MLFNVFGRGISNISDYESVKTIYNLVVRVHIYLLSLSMYITIAAEIRPSSNYLLEHLRLCVFPNGESSVNISERQEVFEIVTSAFVNKELLTVMFYFNLKLLFNSLSFDRMKIYVKQ